jgi:hypothetical protein
MRYKEDVVKTHCEDGQAQAGEGEDNDTKDSQAQEEDGENELENPQNDKVLWHLHHVRVDLSRTSHFAEGY